MAPRGEGVVLLSATENRRSRARGSSLRRLLTTVSRDAAQQGRDRPAASASWGGQRPPFESRVSHVPPEAHPASNRRRVCGAA